ncbi:hypothetical protein C6Y54_18115 [Bacillus cereus]|nr:hypothetical protein C6Y54_18115 [Bacillus cereus]
MNEDKSKHPPYRVKLPGLITEGEIGLGDVIKHITSTVGIQPCDGCNKRADKLNSWITFSGRHHE